MVRVMGAVMTGIIMAGRTGAAFAAQIGTMEVNEEMMPLKLSVFHPWNFWFSKVACPCFRGAAFLPLCGLMGVLGGAIVAMGMLDLNMFQYYIQTKEAVSLNDLWIELFHSAVFWRFGGVRWVSQGNAVWSQRLRCWEMQPLRRW